MAFYDALTDFIFVEDAPRKADLIFLPGGLHGEIALRAAELYRQGYAPLLLVSGRHSILADHFPGPLSPAAYCGRTFATECDFLSQILLDEGIPEQAILKEPTASYTYENAICSRKLTDHLGIHPNTAILCCQAYHARRALLYYQLLYPDTRILVCPAVTCGTSRKNWTKSRESIELVLGEVERCGSQFHEIMQKYTD